MTTYDAWAEKNVIVHVTYKPVLWYIWYSALHMTLDMTLALLWTS